VPNRRRRKLSKALSAAAALAVASPCAYFIVYESTAGPKPEHHEFVPAAGAADLPGELMSALSQGLSQFGINLPPVPSLTGSGTPGLSPAGMTPASTPGLTTPGLISPGLTNPGLTTPGLTTPGLTNSGLTNPGLTNPGLTNPGLTTPGTTAPSATGQVTDPSLANPGLPSPDGTTPGLGNPALTAPNGTAPGLTNPGVTPGLTSPAGLDPSLTSPNAVTPGLTSPNEVPISTPVGLDPGAGGTYPILGDPSLGAAPAAAPSGGVISDLMNTANQLGASQAIDLIKGLVMPSITQAIQNAGPAAAAQAAAAPAAALPAAAAPAT
jgi:hypothetical protein